jgi:hypothetical protein
MMDEHEDDRHHDLPRTTTTGDERRDYRQAGDSSVQSSERDDPRGTPDSPGHTEDDDLLPDVDTGRDEEDEDLGDIERPAGNLTDRPYGES